MGTTAEKGQRVLQSIAEVQEGINNLGGSLTDQTPFKDFRAELDNIYNNLPKTSYSEGSNITLSNTLKGKLDFEDGIVGIGDTSQKSYEGYQLLNYTLATLKSLNTSGTWNNNVYTLNGLTFTVNEDLTITVNGTSTANTDFNIQNFSYTNGNEYTLVDELDGNLYGKYTMMIASFSQWGQNTLITDKYITFTASTTSNISTRIVVYNGNTLSNKTFKPMLYSGAYDSTKDFEPYVGGTASPNPSYPQEIEVVRGKNRAYVNTSTSPNVSDFAKIEQGKTYTFSMKVNGSMSGVNLRYGENVIKTFYGASGNISHTFVAPITGTLNLNGYGVDNFNGYEEIQLEKGSQVTSYLPYNTLEVKVENKNLCTEMEQGDVSTSTGEASSYQPTTSGFIRSKDYIPVKPSEAITVSYKNTATSSIQIVIFEYNANKTYIGFYYSNASTYTRTLGNETAYIKIRLQDTTNTLSNNTEIQVEYGNTKTSYVEHQEQTYQLSLGEYEFAKIGNYVDELLYDVDEDKVYKNEKIGRNDFDENLSYEDFSAYWGQGSFGTRLTNIGTDKIAWSDMLCKYFVAYTSSETKNLNNEMVVGTSSMIFNNLNISTLTEWITWVTTHHFSVFYPKSTSTLIEITDTTLKTQVKALYNSQSFTGTTIIEIDGQLPMIIKVRALKGE